MKGSDSDLRYFSALLLVAFFAVPAIGGPCLFLGDECPMAASRCHEEGAPQDDPFCCEEAAEKASKRSAKTGTPWLLASTPVLSGLVGGAVSESFVPDDAAPQASAGSDLFLFHSSFLI